ncbi:hypothetical protein HFN89_05755 [Rhizobium laguerreae]|nr:hypothetical protein [Rhizobium laguerreae]
MAVSWELIRADHRLSTGSEASKDSAADFPLDFRFVIAAESAHRHICPIVGVVRT